MTNVLYCHIVLNCARLRDCRFASLGGRERCEWGRARVTDSHGVKVEVRNPNQAQPQLAGERRSNRISPTVTQQPIAWSMTMAGILTV